MLASGTFECWLAGDDVPLGPAPENGPGMHPTDRRVNSPRNDDPSASLRAPTRRTLAHAAPWDGLQMAVERSRLEIRAAAIVYASVALVGSAD